MILHDLRLNQVLQMRTIRVTILHTNVLLPDSQLFEVEFDWQLDNRMTFTGDCEASI